MSHNQEVKKVLECDKCFKSLKKSVFKDKIEKSCKAALKTFGFSNNPPSICKLFSDNDFEIWKFRISNPESNRGKSAGFRLFAYFKKREKIMFIYKIFDKKELDKRPKIDCEIEKEIKEILEEN